MIEKTKCCKVPYKMEWVGLKLYAVCSYCGKQYKELGILVLYDEDIVCDS